MSPPVPEAAVDAVWEIVRDWMRESGALALTRTDVRGLLAAAAPLIAAAEFERLADLGDQMDEGDAIRPVVADAMAAERERIRQLAEQHHAHVWTRHISADGESYMAETPFAGLLADPPVPAVPTEGTTP